MNVVLAFLTMWLTDLLVLGTALLAVTCLALVFLRQPAARMALARGTLLGLATLCVLTALPGWPRQPLAEVLSTGAAEEERDEALLVLAEEGAILPAPLMMDAPPAKDEAVQLSAPSAPWLSLAKVIKFLPLFWLGAAGSALLYILIGTWRAFRLLHTAVKPPAWSQLELERIVSQKNRAPRLKTSERIATAVALLAWRPHILLAARSVSEENKAAVRAALAHEWAHIRHGDLWLLALERLLLPIFCLNPLFWLLRRQIRIDQELLADAAAAGDAPVEYAEALMSWAKVENAAAARGFGIAALSLWEHPSSLTRRVEMLLHPQSSARAGASRLWRWLAPLSLMAAVFGLSLITLRPAAVAQDDAVVEVQSRPDKVKKAKREKPKKSEAKRTGDQIPLPVEAGEIILMNILVGQVEHAALENAESSLGDLIQAASEDHCRLEGNLIVADLTAEQFAKLTGELKKAKALEILSRPRVTTIDGQEASLQIGSQVPLVRLEETVNGDPRRRVEFQNVGEMIVICPHVNDKDPSRLTLDITATHTEVDKKAELHTGDDTPRFSTHQFKLAVEASVGKTLVVTEREPKNGSGRTNSILLAIGPQKIETPAPEPAPPVVTKANREYGLPGNGGEKFKFTGDHDRLTMFVNTSRIVEFPREVPKMLLKDPDLVRVVPLSPRSIQVSGLKPGTTQLSVWSAGDKPSSIDIVISNDIDGLRDENEELRKQIVDLQAKLVDLEVQIRWLRAAAAPGGEDKVSDEVFLRRVYLDLTGLIPTAEETKSFLNDKDRQKRNKLIDSLLGNAAKKEASSGRIKWKDAVASDPEAQTTTIKTATKETQKDPDFIQVFNLAHSLAAEVAQVLAKVLPQAEGLTVAVEERTNSLILRGSPEAMQKAKALLEALDREVDPKPAVKEPNPNENGASLRELKYADLRAAEASLQAAKARYDHIQILHKEKAVSEAELDQATVQLKHAEVVLEAAKGGKDLVKLRELELQEAEAALRTAERALLEGESMRAAGKLSSEAVEALSLDLRKKNAGARHARLRLERTKNMP